MTAQIIPIKKTRNLHCPKCGATATASCDCGVAYVRAGQIAERAVRANPEKSDRAIAKDIGVDQKTVWKARKSTEENSSVEKRVGLDGKARRLPQKRKEKDDQNVKCNPILTNDPWVNEVLIKIYDFITPTGWTDHQLELFIGAIRKLHNGSKGTVEWEEAVEKQRRERQARSERRKLEKQARRSKQAKGENHG